VYLYWHKTNIDPMESLTKFELYTIFYFFFFLEVHMLICICCLIGNLVRF